MATSEESKASADPSKRSTVIVVLVVLHVGVFAMFLFRRTDPPAVKPPPKKPKPAKVVNVGGVRRPATDVRLRGGSGTAKGGQTAEPEAEFSNVGRTPAIPTDANPMVASVAEAFKTGKHPERLTSMISPEAFDKAAFEADPEAYLNVVEPGRVWQPAQPGPNVSRLQAVSPRYLEMVQGETVSLKTKAIPGAPVTFTSFDLGAFQNRLTSITVQADDTGTATARFTGTPGTYNDVNIVAASPLTSGQAKFVVNILLPQ